MILGSNLVNYIFFSGKIYLLLYSLSTMSKLKKSVVLFYYYELNILFFFFISDMFINFYSQNYEIFDIRSSN
jgi:hypothetical protein